MANRTTAVEVIAIMGTELSSTIVDAYIPGANIMVTNVLNSSGLNDDTLAPIETWLTAHMIASTRERLAKKEGAGGASIEYTGNFNFSGLEATTYGQMVEVLDTTGKMKELAKKSASTFAITSFD